MPCIAGSFCKNKEGSVFPPHLASSPGMTQRAELLRGAANRQGAGRRIRAGDKRGVEKEEVRGRGEDDSALPATGPRS